MARSGRRRGTAITIQAVAEHAGVSAMTVSNVINGTGKVGTATRERVRAAIAQLGYVPNLAARGLASAGIVRVGLIYDEPQSPFVSAMLIGALNMTSARGVQLMIRRQSDYSVAGAAESAAALVRSGANALLLMPPFAELLSGRPIVRDLNVPLAAVATGGALPDVSTVRIDDGAAAFAITALLIRHGHRRIGLIAGPDNHSGSALRRAGYLAALDAHGLSTDPSLQVPGNYLFDGGIVGARALLDLPDPPTAIFASNDDMAGGVVSLAQSRGVRIPDALEVVGFDDTPISRQLFPALTTIRQPITEMAEQATAALIDAVAHSGAAPQDTILDYVLVERASTGSCL